MWYKLTRAGQAPLSVGSRLISKDSRFSVAHYSVDHGRSPPRWDLHISNVRLTDAADYQCHCAWKNPTRHSSRSTVKLIVQGTRLSRQTGRCVYVCVCVYLKKNRSHRWRNELIINRTTI